MISCVGSITRPIGFLREGHRKSIGKHRRREKGRRERGTIWWLWLSEPSNCFPFPSPLPFSSLTLALSSPMLFLCPSCGKPIRRVIDPTLEIIHAATRSFDNWGNSKISQVVLRTYWLQTKRCTNISQSFLSTQQTKLINHKIVQKSNSLKMNS